jgi:hypothetical protein
VFATITHIPRLHKIRRNAPRYHPTNPLATPNIIRNKTQQLDRCIRQCQNIAQFLSATNNLAQDGMYQVYGKLTTANALLVL